LNESLKSLKKGIDNLFVDFLNEYWNRIMNRRFVISDGESHYKIKEAYSIWNQKMNESVEKVIKIVLIEKKF
jgi:hypothetical protein